MLFGADVRLCRCASFLWRLARCSAVLLKGWRGRGVLGFRAGLRRFAVNAWRSCGVMRAVSRFRAGQGRCAVRAWIWTWRSLPPFPMTRKNPSRGMSAIFSESASFIRRPQPYNNVKSAASRCPIQSWRASRPAFSSTSIACFSCRGRGSLWGSFGLRTGEIAALCMKPCLSSQLSRFFTPDNDRARLALLAPFMALRDIHARKSRRSTFESASEVRGFSRA